MEIIEPTGNNERASALFFQATAPLASTEVNILEASASLLNLKNRY